MDSQTILNNVSDKWLDIIYKGKTKTLLDDFIEAGNNDTHTIVWSNICPPPDKIFEWCRLTDLDNIKVIIVGQDPYHDGTAHGLSFSSTGNKIPASLRNIYKCLEKTYGSYPKTANLTEWATQGVLMINAALSTRSKKAGAHMKYWMDYSKEVISRICSYYYEKNEQLIFMLWGKFAEKLCMNVDNDYHIILRWIHPSPLAQRVVENKKFINCTNFIEVNKCLKRDNKKEINWVRTAKLTNNNKLTNNKKDENWQITPDIHYIFTDGSCNPNTKNPSSRGGYATIFASGYFKGKQIYGNLDISDIYASNIRAEGMAIIRAMETVLEKDSVDDEKFRDNWADMTDRDDWKVCNIVTDCQFWIDMLTKYMKNWAPGKFDIQQNPDLTKRMWKLWCELRCLDKEINILHIKSHNKSGWGNKSEGTYERWCYDFNEKADVLCGKARRELKPGEEKIN